MIFPQFLQRKLMSDSLSTICFTSDHILKMIKNLDPNKAHGYDMIIIRMVKLCDVSLCKPLELIFKSCLESEEFPLEWKYANVVTAYKKKISRY